MAGDQPVTAGPTVQPTPTSTSGAPHADPGQRPTPQTQGPYLNPEAPAAPGYTYSGPGQTETDADANKHLHDNRQNDNDGDPSGRIGASGGGYKVTLPELKQIHGQVTDMLEATKQDYDHAMQVARATPSAKDADGSVMYATGLTQWGEELTHEISGHRTALQSYANHLQSVIDNYSNNEVDGMVTFKDFQGKL